MRPAMLWGTALLTLISACSPDAPGETSDAGVPALAPGGASFERFSYSNNAGTRSYKLFVPADAVGAGPHPLIVDLHGCNSSADEEARWSRFNRYAETDTFLVAYPEQSADANGSGCWNWFLPNQQRRDSEEPSIIAGIADTIAQAYDVDPARTYITGISAGAAMANIVAVNYPDRFAAVMIYAGCEYQGTTCTAGIAYLPAEVSGERAYQAMGDHARVIPALVLQGSQDVQVPYPNADLIVGQYLASDDWADDGANNGSVSREPARTEIGQVPGGHSYEIDSYENAQGCVLVQRWLVNGMGHAWSQGESDGSPRDLLLTDPLGPDLTRATLDFLWAHPLTADAPCP